MQQVMTFVREGAPQVKTKEVAKSSKEKVQQVPKPQVEFDPGSSPATTIANRTPIVPILSSMQSFPSTVSHVSCLFSRWGVTVWVWGGWSVIVEFGVELLSPILFDTLMPFSGYPTILPGSDEVDPTCGPSTFECDVDPSDYLVIPTWELSNDKAWADSWRIPEYTTIPGSPSHSELELIYDLDGSSEYTSDGNFGYDSDGSSEYGSDSNSGCCSDGHFRCGLEESLDCDWDGKTRGTARKEFRSTTSYIYSDSDGYDGLSGAHPLITCSLLTL